MALTQTSLADVRLLLRTRCTVALTGAGGLHGTGFFIDRDLVLTCAHVVGAKAGHEVRVHLVGGAERKGVIKKYLPGNELDIALVEVHLRPEDPPPTAVVLESFLTDNIDYYAVGYPREALTGSAGLQEISYRTNASYEVDNVTPRTISLQSGGALILPGMSGGALLSSQSGAVVGIVQWSNELEGDKGGGAIPVNRVAQHFTEVSERVARPPAATRAWRNALGPDGWQQLGHDWRYSLTYTWIPDDDNGPN